MVLYTLEQRWEVGLRPTYRRCQFWQKKNNLWSSFWSWQICKQANFSHLGHRNPARIHWKADAPKASHCLVRILVQRHNRAIFLRKWARRGRYSQWLSLSLLTRLDCYLWGAVKDKRYTDKPETIYALKDNIREAIGEIQLHTIDRVLQNWTNCGDYCMANRGSHLSEIIFHY